MPYKDGTGPLGTGPIGGGRGPCGGGARRGGGYGRGLGLGRRGAFQASANEAPVDETQALKARVAELEKRLNEKGEGK